MSKHTPGPWKSIAWDDNTSRQKESIVVDLEQRKVAIACHIYDGRMEEWENVEANALLIAAAPELLHEARRCADEFGHTGAVTADSIRQLMAAITKATGGDK